MRAAAGERRPSQPLFSAASQRLFCARQTAMDERASLCVRCDTDSLLRPVMAALLGEEGFAGWEASLIGTREEEDRQREYSGTKYGDVFCMKV